MSVTVVMYVFYSYISARAGYVHIQKGLQLQFSYAKANGSVSTIPTYIA